MGLPDYTSADTFWDGAVGKIDRIPRAVEHDIRLTDEEREMVRRHEEREARRA